MAIAIFEVGGQVRAAKKGSPDLIERRFKLANQAIGEITIASLESKEESGSVFISYLFPLQQSVRSPDKRFASGQSAVLPVREFPLLHQGDTNRR
jgi:hypothetical protein